MPQSQTLRARWYAGDAPTGVRSQDEIDMAVADARCQSVHPVLAVAEEETLALAEQWIDDNADLIAEAADAQRFAMQMAETELGAS